MDTRLVAREKQLESWALIIQECKNSGLKTKDWLDQNNISKDQYYYWLRLVRENAYIECEDVDTSQDISTDMITINHGQLNISIPVTADVNIIRTIMEVAVRAK